MAYEFLATARYLAHAAGERRLVTYGDLEKPFGGIAQGWGKPLTDVTNRLHRQGLPLLSVLVVAKGYDLPSLGAEVYGHLALRDADAIRAEQRRCFGNDWSDLIARIST